MGNGIIAFMVAGGFSAWLYAKVMHSTGGNLKTAVIAIAVCGLIVLLVVWTLLSRFLPEL